MEYDDISYKNEKKNVLRYISERIEYCKNVIKPIPKNAKDYNDLIANWNGKITALEDLYSWVYKFDRF